MRELLAGTNLDGATLVSTKPADVAFATKPELAQQMPARLLASDTTVP